MSVCTVPAFGAAETENVNVPKYIFLFIGDGMSYPQVQTTNYYLNAIADDGDDVLTSESKLNMMKFPVAGSAQTYDSTSFCPDSASTATSISTGHKTYSGTINMDEKMETSYETIAEKLKKQLGYKVGILSLPFLSVLEIWISMLSVSIFIYFDITFAIVEKSNKIFL